MKPKTCPNRCIFFLWIIFDFFRNFRLKGGFEPATTTAIVSMLEGTKSGSNSCVCLLTLAKTLSKLVVCNFISSWKETSQLALLSSNLSLMDKWNVHQWEDRILAEAVDSSFTLREKHSTSSSKLSCVSLLKHKDGTRTIEMILKSTVLPWTAFPGFISVLIPRIIVASSLHP